MKKALFWERLIWLWVLVFPVAFAGSFSSSLGSAQVNQVLVSPGPIGSVTPNTGAFTSFTDTYVTYSAAHINRAGSDIILQSNGGTNSRVVIGFGSQNMIFDAGAGTASIPTYLLFGTLLFSSTAPTIASGFGTSPSITNANGTAAFRVNVGTGGTASSGVVTMPAASNNYNCFVSELGGASTITRMISSTSTSVTVQSSAAWASGQVLQFMCTGE